MNGRARVSVPLGDPGDPVILRSCHSERSEESVPLPIRASTDSALRSKSPKGRQLGGSRCGGAARLRGLHGAGITTCARARDPAEMLIGRINLTLILEQWDELVRLAA